MANTDDVLAAAERIGFTVPPEHLAGYAEQLHHLESAVQAVLACPDYKPVPDLARWPRTNVHQPEPADNPLRAWACRADVGDETSRSGALTGNTVVLKDTICLANVPLRIGTDAFEGYVPDVDATVVTRVLEHGGKIIGKATCENFSYGGQSSSSSYGPVENPYARGFSAGGSSSGCGALVASEVADMAIGGDQGGSIRIPSAQCGLVGLKPTFGLVPYTGIVTFDPAVDSAGPMARTVLDAATLLRAIAGYDGIDDRQLGAPRPKNVENYTQTVLSARQGGADARRPLEGVRIGVLKEAFEHPALATHYSAVVKRAISGLETLGAEVVSISVPFFNMAGDIEAVTVDFAAQPTREGMQVGRRGLYLNDYWGTVLPWTQDKLDKAKYYFTGCALSGAHAWPKHPTAYGRAMNLTRKLRDDVDDALDRLDAIVTPTLIEPARRHLTFNGGPSEWDSIRCGTFTGAWNISGHPALSLPVGMCPPMPVDIKTAADSALRLPVGMQLIGKYWSEGKLLSIADAWEQNFDWKSRREE